MMDKKAILAKHLGKLRNKYEKNITWTVRCDVCRTGICESGICISCLEAEELLDQILTAHTEPEDEPFWKPHPTVEKIFNCECADCVEARTQITLRKWKEYEHWLGEWNGDEPAPQEHITFEDWLQEA